LNALKEKLKRFAIVREVNSRAKAAALVAERAYLRANFSGKARMRGIVHDPALVPLQVSDRLRARGIEPEAFPDRPGVLWVGADEQQDRGGFLQSLERNTELTCFRRPGGAYGLQIESEDGGIRRLDPWVVRMNDRQLVRLVEERIRNGPPLHIVMGQMWAHVISAEALRRVQALGVAVVNVSMDDRLPLHWRSLRGQRLGSVGLSSGVDLVLTTTPESCLWYAVEGCPATWWPLASDPAVFAPVDESAKVHDISFVGRRYGARDQIVTSLLNAGLPVAAFGPGWPRGAVEATEVARIFAESRMILGVGTVAHNRSVYTLKLRDFDATMAGALYLTHRNPDLQPLFEEGSEIEFYSDTDELRKKVIFYLENPARRQEVARNARARALRDHSWDVRLGEVFSIVRGRSGAETRPAAIA
jgi:spore maturation protein CgeB